MTNIVVGRTILILNLYEGFQQQIQLNFIINKSHNFHIWQAALQKYSKRIIYNRGQPGIQIVNLSAMAIYEKFYMKNKIFFSIYFCLKWDGKTFHDVISGIMFEGLTGV